MQIKGLRIAGLPAVDVRNMLRGVHSFLDSDFVAERCKVSTPRAEEIVRALVDDGYIVFSERDRNVDYYKLTEKGDKLMQASAVNKMPRARAEQIIAALMKRVEEVNANADYMFRIPTVIAYGSYVRGGPRLSDVDIALDLEAKWDSANVKQYSEWRDKRVDAARANGRKVSSMENTPHREVMLHLKARTKGLSLHELNDFISMKKDENFAYKVLLGDEARVTEQIAKGAAWRA